MSEAKLLCTILLANLRLQYMVFQNNHWEAEGPSFYGQHLMYQRAYESTQEHIDALAEKMVAQFGAESVNLFNSCNVIHATMGLLAEFPNPEQRALKTIAIVKGAIAKILECGGNDVSLGLENALQTIFDEQETTEYLIQQVVK